jgi:hypothetical protein
MKKKRITRERLEEWLWLQSAYIDTLAETIRLQRIQIDLINKMNTKLREELNQVPKVKKVANTYGGKKGKQVEAVTGSTRITTTVDG